MAVTPVIITQPKRHSVVVQNNYLSSAAQQCLPLKIPQKKKSRQSKMRTIVGETQKKSAEHLKREGSAEDKMHS